MATVGGTPGVPEELLESAKSEVVRVCKESGTPCPLRARGGGLLSLPELRRPTLKITWGFALTRLNITTTNDSFELAIGRVCC